MVADQSVDVFLHPSGIRLYLRSFWGEEEDIDGYFVNNTWVDKEAVVITDKSGVRGSEFTE